MGQKKPLSSPVVCNGMERRCVAWEGHRRTVGRSVWSATQGETQIDSCICRMRGEWLELEAILRLKAKAKEEEEGREIETEAQSGKKE